MTPLGTNLLGRCSVVQVMTPTPGAVARSD